MTLTPPRLDIWIYHYPRRPVPRATVAPGAIVRDLDSLTLVTPGLLNPRGAEVPNFESGTAISLDDRFQYDRTLAVGAGYTRQTRYLVRDRWYAEMRFARSYYYSIAGLADVDAWLRGGSRWADQPREAFVVTGVHVAQDRGEEEAERSIAVETITENGVEKEPTTTSLDGMLFGICVTRLSYKKSMGFGPRKLVIEENWAGGDLL